MISGNGIKLLNNEIKDIIKLIKSLENRGNFLKRTSRKVNSQKEALLNFLGPLMKVRLPLMKNVLTSLAKIVLLPLGLAASASATDPAIQQEIYGSGMAILIIWNKKKERYHEILWYLEESGLLIKGVSETIQNEKTAK